MDIGLNGRFIGFWGNFMNTRIDRKLSVWVVLHAGYTYLLGVSEQNDGDIFCFTLVKIENSQGQTGFMKMVQNHFFWNFPQGSL